MSRNSRRVPSYAMILLLHQLFTTAAESGIPPVTLLLIGAQVSLAMGFIQVPWGDDTHDICMSVDTVYFGKDYKRFLFAPFTHGDDYHLYYNMVSFMWKGKTLEKVYGSGYFAFICLVFTFLTNVIYLALNYMLSTLMFDKSFMFSCAVGFSGTIFALKVLSTSLLQTQSTQFVFGIPFSGKWAVWGELVLISLVTPNASFVGHLAGIIVGTLYTHGPLKYIMQAIWTPVLAIWEAFQTQNGQNPNRAGPSSHSSYNDDDEAMRRAREESYRQYMQSNGFGYGQGLGGGSFYADPLRRRRTAFGLF